MSNWALLLMRGFADLSVRGCGTHITAARMLSGERRFQSQRLPAESENATATLDVYFHVVYANETYEGGFVP